jgi:hypothetical protein
MDRRFTRALVPLLLAGGTLLAFATTSSSAFDLGPIIAETIDLTEGPPAHSLIQGLPTDIFAPTPRLPVQ